jgi:hypothetical protein
MGSSYINWTCHPDLLPDHYLCFLYYSLAIEIDSPPSRRTLGEFSRIESFAPIFREPVRQQYRDLEASSVDTRTRLAYERARTLVKALGKEYYNPHVA